MQDVLDKTGCGRSTFYAHFENKFDLLTSTVPSITVPIASTGEPMPDLMPLFEHVQEMLPVLRPLLTQPLVGEISDVFRRELADAWRQHLASRGVSEARCDTPALFLAGAFLAVCIDWVERNCARPVNELCAQYTDLATAAVEQEVDYQAKLDLNR